jgi:hypothetical protein
MKQSKTTIQSNTFRNHIVIPLVSVMCYNGLQRRDSAWRFYSPPAVRVITMTKYVSPFIIILTGELSKRNHMIVSNVTYSEWKEYARSIAHVEKGITLPYSDVVGSAL